MKKQKHKKLQENNTFLEFLLAYGWAIIIIVLVVSVLLYFGKIGTANWRLQKFCEYESDNCVFTPNDKFLAMYPSAKYSDSALNTIQQYCNEHKRRDICDFRKKTQAEQDLDSCNSNPREDNNCHCTKYFNCIKSINTYINHPAFFVKTNDKGINFSDKQGYFSFFNIPPESERCDDFGFILQYDYNLKEQKEEIIYDDTDTDFCLKSRPKTDWEKYPENYIQEIKTVINEEWVHNCCEEVNISLKNINMLYTANFICFEVNDSAFSQINTVNVSKCQATSKFINQTTYRLKNECEKGNPDWVEENILLQYSCASKYKTIEATYNKIGKYSETWNKNLHIYYCNSDLDCDWLDCGDEKAGTLYCLEELYQNDKSLIEGDFYNGSCQTKYQSICREKTEVEKLMNKDCKQIVDELDKIRRTEFPSKTKAEKLMSYLDVIKIKECPMPNKIFIVED